MILFKFIFTFTLSAIISASFASAGPVVLDNATLLLNGQQAQILNSQFQSLMISDSCNSGETACVKSAFAACLNYAWRVQTCPSSKLCFALPQIRTNGTFVACTSPNNAASIIAATGAQGGISMSLVNTTVPFPIVNNSSPQNGSGRTDSNGDDGSLVPDNGKNITQGGNDGGNSDCGNDAKSFSPAPTVTTTTVIVTVPVTILPPTTTTLSPQQALSLFSSLSFNSLKVPISATPGADTSSSNNQGSNAGGPPPVIQLTPRPILLSTLAPTPSLRVTPTPVNKEYPY